MLVSAKVVANEDEALKKINGVLASGAAAELFGKMIHALGGPSDFMEDPWRSMQRGNIIVDVLAPEHGYINGMQTRDIGMAVVGLKGGRTANGQQIDHSVGFDRILPTGTRVNRGDVVARVHASDESSASIASQQYLSSLVINETQNEEPPVIYQTISK